ncbi:MAG TPA: class I SAM-dependent methyltransferase, partial [Chthonomonadales bacterium]|nr:class I SAM-dependent methyltransferase [Chthonomonadales bacterium]
ADFRGVTETPGLPANPEQLAMLYARYHLGAELARDRDVLEVACGSGIGLAYIARRARRAVGGDVDPALLAIAKANCAGLADVSLMDALALPCDDEAFDVVVLLEAVYYLRDAPRFVEEARRVLRPGGYLYVCSANCEREAFNPSPMSVRYYPASTLGAMLREQGFEVGLSAAFPERADGIQGSLMSAAWRLAVRWRLVPRTMRGKSIVKRLLYRNSRPIPAVLTDGIAPLEPRVPVTADAPVRDFKVLYAVGRKAG